MPVSASESCLNRVSATETGGKRGYVGVKFGNLMAPLGKLSPYGGNLGGRLPCVTRSSICYFMTVVTQDGKS